MMSFLGFLGFVALMVGVMIWVLMYREGYSRQGMEGLPEETDSDASR